MKLLFITQKVDLDDSVLGAYHEWIEEFNKKLAKVTVICLYCGRSALSSAIDVYSLGKEARRSKFTYLVNFYKHIWNLRSKYDAVLVHMNPIYVVLGALFWRVSGKKIYLWYNHPLGNWLCRLAIFFSKIVFCTSQFSFAAKYKKAAVMPVGVDTAFFIRRPDINKIPGSVLFLGRLSPVKHIEVLLKAARILLARGVKFGVSIVGDTPSDVDKIYAEDIKKTFSDLVSLGAADFKPGVPSKATVDLYNSYDVFVNTTLTGSFDKTIIEAAACETMILVSNKVMTGFLSSDLADKFLFREGDPSDLADKLSYLLSASEEEKRIWGGQLRNVAEAHSLNRLMDLLAGKINN